MLMACLHLSACDVRPPALTEEKVPIMNTHNTDEVKTVEIATPAPEGATTAVQRIQIGNVTHRYELLKTVEPSVAIREPVMRTVTTPDGKLKLILPLEKDEAIWGFGQRFDAFNLRGRKLESWATDGWNALDTSYYAVPFFISSKGYGLFINHPGRIDFNIGAEKHHELSIVIPDRGVELISFKGDPAAISKAYTELVGRPRSAPDWIFRLWISRNSFLGAYEVDRVVHHMSELGMPVGVVVLEAWEEQLHNFRFTTHRYPNPVEWISKLKERGVHVVCWLTSSMWPGTEVYEQAKERNFLVLNEDGSEHVVRWLENGRKIDFRKPGALEWWRDLHLPLVEMGVDGFKTDGGEHMPDPVFHNQHTYYYQKGTLDAFNDAGRHGITFARSANPLNARLGAYWAGDQNAEWSGLKAVIRGGLSTSLCGFYLWGHDIGAYTGTPTKELYLRWLQLGVFSPIMQMHGITAREPWHFDQETVDIARFYFQVREKLLTNIVQWAGTAIEDGTPILRPLVWDFPGDHAVYNLDSQFMFGPDLLVAPISDPLDLRGVYLPEGDWVDVWNGTKYTGPIELLKRAAIHEIPVFARSEAYDAYRDLFFGAPVRETKAITVTLAGEKNDRGIVPALRYWKHGSEPAQFYYELKNSSDQKMIIETRLPAAAGYLIEPSNPVRFTLGTGDVQRLVYTVSPSGALPPGTYPLHLQVRDESGMKIETPTMGLVISPSWKVLGPLEGSVGSNQTEIDPQKIYFNRTYPGKHGTRVSWIEIPDDALKNDGLINIEQVIGGEGSSTCFLYAMVPSPTTRKVRLLTGSGDAMTIWLNGREVLHVDGHRNSERDEDSTPVELVAGTNHFLIRISRDLGQNHMYFRIVD